MMERVGGWMIKSEWKGERLWVTEWVKNNVSEWKRSGVSDKIVRQILEKSNWYLASYESLEYLDSESVWCHIGTIEQFYELYQFVRTDLNPN
jgi:hypothetical protein